VFREGENYQQLPGRFLGVLCKIDFSQQGREIFKKTLEDFI
jgi:hypothetical protein